MFRLTDRLDMTIAVDCNFKQQTKKTKVQFCTGTVAVHFLVVFNSLPASSIAFANSLNPNQAQQNVWPDLNT